MHEHMAIMIRVSKTIYGNWEQTLMHTTTYSPTPIHRRFDARAGVYGGFVGRSVCKLHFVLLAASWSLHL